MIQPVITIDTRSINRAIAEVNKNTDRSLAESVNKKMLFILRKCIRFTKKADRELIKSVFSDGEAAGKLINAMRAAKGLRGLNGANMVKAIKAELSRRLRSIAFLRSQWKWAIRQLAAAMGLMSPKITGSQKGGARPAPKEGRIGRNITASAWNEVEGGKHPSSQIQAVLEHGAQLAVNAEAEDTWAHAVEKELKRKALDRFNNHH